MTTLPLGPATTTWNDYIGTAAADDADVRLGSPSLYQLAGLNRDRWRIVGLDLHVRNSKPEVILYAVDLAQHDPDRWDIEQIIDDHERVPVTAIELSEPHVDTFLNDAFRRIAIRMVSKGLRDASLVVSDRTSSTANLDSAPTPRYR